MWEELASYWKESKLPSMFIGDFNETLSPSDRGSQFFSTEGSNDFQNFLQEVEVIEISPSNGSFTWFHNNRKSKLDRCFVNPEWITTFPQLCTSLLNRTISDHCPILAQTSLPSNGPTPFRFLNRWINHPTYLPTIRKVWLDNSHLLVPDKLKMVKEKLKSWNKNEFGSIDDNIRRLENQIQRFDSLASARNLDENELHDRKLAQLQLWTWLKRKESYWAQNSRSKWIKEGDRNTKYFHTLASIRKRKNSISSLMLNSTNPVHFADLSKEASNYFRNLFKEELNIRPRFENLKFKRLLPSQVSMLTEPVSD